MSVLAGALTDSPNWMLWVVYGLAWFAGHAGYWLLVTPTRNMEAIAPGASAVYWLAVGWSMTLAGWGWKSSKHVFGVGEAVDFGSAASRLGKVPAWTIRYQTKLRVWAATWGLLVGWGALAFLAIVGLAGAWSLALGPVVVLTRLRRAQRLQRWNRP